MPMARTYLLKVPFTENDGSLMLMHVSKNGERGNVKEEGKECLDVEVKSTIKAPWTGQSGAAALPRRNRTWFAVS